MPSTDEVGSCGRFGALSLRHFGFRSAVGDLDVELNEELHHLLLRCRPRLER
jgi:hypothetical protein